MDIRKSIFSKIVFVGLLLIGNRVDAMVPDDQKEVKKSAKTRKNAKKKARKKAKKKAARALGEDKKVLQQMQPIGPSTLSLSASSSLSADPLSLASPADPLPLERSFSLLHLDDAKQVSQPQSGLSFLSLLSSPLCSGSFSLRPGGFGGQVEGQASSSSSMFSDLSSLSEPLPGSRRQLFAPVVSDGDAKKEAECKSVITPAIVDRFFVTNFLNFNPVGIVLSDSKLADGKSIADLGKAGLDGKLIQDRSLLIQGLDIEDFVNQFAPYQAGGYQAPGQKIIDFCSWEFQLSRLSKLFEQSKGFEYVDDYDAFQKDFLGRVHRRSLFSLQDSGGYIEFSPLKKKLLSLNRYHETIRPSFENIVMRCSHLALVMKEKLERDFLYEKVLSHEIDSQLKRSLMYELKIYKNLVDLFEGDLKDVKALQTFVNQKIDEKRQHLQFKCVHGVFDEYFTQRVTEFDGLTHGQVEKEKKELARTQRDEANVRFPGIIHLRKQRDALKAKVEKYCDQATLTAVQTLVSDECKQFAIEEIQALRKMLSRYFAKKYVVSAGRMNAVLLAFVLVEQTVQGNFENVQVLVNYLNSKKSTSQIASLAMDLFDYFLEDLNISILKEAEMAIEFTLPITIARVVRKVVNQSIDAKKLDIKQVAKQQKDAKQLKDQLAEFVVRPTSFFQEDVDIKDPLDHLVRVCIRALQVGRDDKMIKKNTEEYMRAELAKLFAQKLDPALVDICIASAFARIKRYFEVRRALDKVKKAKELAYDFDNQKLKKFRQVVLGNVKAFVKATAPLLSRSAEMISRVELLERFYAWHTEGIFQEFLPSVSSSTASSSSSSSSSQGR